MTNGVCPDFQTLHRLSRGLLNSTKINEIELHVANCDNCIRVLRGLNDSVNLHSTVFELDEQKSSLPTRWEVGNTIASRFRLTHKCGEGGMGAVWAAEDLFNPPRMVALKRLHARFGEEFSKRFVRERMILAQLDHHHIARLVDYGETDWLEPFLVMELVEGQPINRFCVLESLSLEQRLELFLQVCQAVIHAHQNGIIHRDLKPSNILVRKVDTAPHVKVIDFGIAKILGVDDPALSALTQAGEVFGTLAYMSPEQTQHQYHVDARTDIYSLGVVLYELLTGQTPISSAILRELGPFAAVDAIRNVDVQRPSTLFSSPTTEQSDHLRTLNESRIAYRAKLSNDLDWIVLKALEKTPDARYQTVQELTNDIERYLANEAVLVRPPSLAYRLAKFYRRRRSLAFAAFVSLLFLLVGLTGLVYGLRQAWLAWKTEATARVNAEVLLKEVQQQRDVAEAAHEYSVGLLDELAGLKDLDHGLPKPGFDSAQQRAILEKLLILYRDASEKVGKTEKLRAHIASSRLKLAWIQFRLSNNREAISTALEVVKDFQQLEEEFPENNSYLIERGDAFIVASDSCLRVGELSDAELFAMQAEHAFTQAMHKTDASNELKLRATNAQLNRLLATQLALPVDEAQSRFQNLLHCLEECIADIGVERCASVYTTTILRWSNFCRVNGRPNASLELLQVAVERLESLSKKQISPARMRMEAQLRAEIARIATGDVRFNSLSSARELQLQVLNNNPADLEIKRELVYSELALAQYHWSTTSELKES